MHTRRQKTLGASGVLLEPERRLGLAAVQVGSAPAEPALERELRHRGRSLGRIVVGARAPGEPYAPGDVALVEILSAQLALALDAVALATQLQISRGQIVTAREEERRRLRRDLHDGLGPALAGIALTLQAAENTGGPAADDLVSGARAELQDVVGEIRHIVHGLRPPILDDLGLAAAIRAHADHLAPLAVELDAPDLPVRLSAAAELAVYRIATEALTNVVRHAHASTCRVALHGDGDETVLEITDDGRGLDPGAGPGVGLRSMRERAAELGGQIVLSQASQGGLAVARPAAEHERTAAVIRVLVVDDNAIFRQGMRQLVDSIAGLEVSAVAGDGASGVDAALALQVDIVLMDLAMPGLSGIDATRKLAAAAPHIGIIAMTMLEDDDMVVQALRAGARGYLVKGATQREILDTIRGVHAGQAVIGSDIAPAARAASSAARRPRTRSPTSPTANARSSTCSPPEPPRLRSPTGSASPPRPCRNHLSSTFTKIEALDRTQAVLKARAAGLPRARER